MEIEITADAVAVHGIPRQLRVSRSADALPADRNVVVVGINYAPEPVGIAPYTTAICEYLATRARLVTVLTGLPHYPTWRVPAAYRGFRRNPEQHTPSLHVIRHRHFVPRGRSALGHGAYESSFLARVSRSTLEHRPDLVVAVTPSASGAIAGARIAERYDVPLVVLVHSGPPARPGAADTAEARALRAATRLVVLEPPERSRLIALGVADDRIDLVPTWSHITPSPLAPDEARRRLGWPAGRFTVLHTGEIGHTQGLSTAVQAAAELDRRGEPVELVLAGDGGRRRALQAMAKGLPHVRFLDPVGADDYPLVLAAADLFLLSERERLTDPTVPAALTSYLMAARPIVAAVDPAGPTAAELARVPGSYQLVPPGRGRDLAEAIAGLRPAEQRRREMAASASAFAAGHLSAAAAMRRLEQVLVEALG